MEPTRTLVLLECQDYRHLYRKGSKPVKRILKKHNKGAEFILILHKNPGEDILGKISASIKRAPQQVTSLKTHIVRDRIGHRTPAQIISRILETSSANYPIFFVVVGDGSTIKAIKVMKEINKEKWSVGEYHSLKA